MAAVLKTVSGVTHSGVRIPLPPPDSMRFAVAESDGQRREPDESACRLILIEQQSHLASERARCVEDIGKTMKWNSFEFLWLHFV